MNGHHKVEEQIDRPPRRHHHHLGSFYEMLPVVFILRNVRSISEQEQEKMEMPP